MITDQTVQELYSVACKALPMERRDPDHRIAQFFRGVTSLQWKNDPHPSSCSLYISIFKEYEVIPEYCFNCFKVFVEPRNVVELFKLMVLFHRERFPGNSSRKCMVERRPGIPGFYKGYLYCQSLDEGMALLEVTRNLVEQEISDKIPVTLKRGCSEYQVLYPEYGHTGHGEESLMSYPVEWRDKERHAIDTIGGKFPAMAHRSYDHEGFDENDALAMSAWVAYAAAIGDSSYLNVAPLTLIAPMRNIERVFRKS